MSFSDLQLKVAAETAVMGLQKHLGSLKYFAHNFKELEDKKGSAIAVPVYDLTDAAEFDADSNNWGSGENQIGGITVNLEKHLIKSIALDDVSNGNVDVNFLRDGSAAIVDVLGHATNRYVYGLINETNVATSATMPTTKAAFAGLMKICDDNGVNPYECCLILNPENFGALLSTLDANIYGGSEAVRYGVISNLYGFRAVIMSSYLPSGTKGCIIPYGTLGIASRVNKPAINGYVNTWTATTDDGFAIGFRVYEDLDKGVARLGADVLLGARILQNGIIRLV